MIYTKYGSPVRIVSGDTSTEKVKVENEIGEWFDTTIKELEADNGLQEIDSDINASSCPDVQESDEPLFEYNESLFGMEFQTYQYKSKRTMPNKTWEESVASYGMGIAGEAGEVTDLLKKGLYHGHDFDKEKIEKELGDVLHYTSGIAELFGLSLQEIAKKNLQKLQERYPNGFSEEDSKNRKN